MIATINKDSNGNKSIQIKGLNGYRGFSVQTNGYLPRIHREPPGTLRLTEAQKGELFNFVNIYGTEKEKETLKQYD